MKQLKTNDIVKALTKKGFIMEKGHRHIRFFLVVDGKKTSISTMLSHGGSEPRQTLLHQIKNEIGFTDPNDFERYVECSMKLDEYKAYLIKNNKI